jgi:hypothetical protein
MPAQRRIETPARARAVADLPIEPLLEHAGELARRWAIALIVERPLDGIGAVPLEEIARDAPALCAQALRAVQSEVELERLTGRGAPTGREDSAAARRLAAICGARDAAAVVEAVEALRGVLWEALLDELRGPPSRLVGDICDRLAYVCASALAVAVEAVSTSELARADDAQPASETPATVVAEREGVQTHAAPRSAVIVDEYPHELSRSWERTPPATAGAAAAEIEIRDERREEGPTAWIKSIGAQLQRFERDRLPFAVLLVEIVELEQLRAQESPEELLRLTGALEQLLTSALGTWSGSLTRERPGRCWVLAPGTDRAGAERLAELVTRAVAASAGHRGLPLAVAVGTAVCPEDGTEGAALAAHADLGLYAARFATRASRTGAAAIVDESA